MCRIVCIVLSIICQDREVPGLRDAEPRSLLFSLEVSRRQDFLVVRRPPVWSTRGTEDKFIAVVENDERVIGVCGGDQNYAHDGGGLLKLGWLLMLEFSLLSPLNSEVSREERSRAVLWRLDIPLLDRLARVHDGTLFGGLIAVKMYADS